MSFHINSEAVDWRLNYKMPAIGDELSFGDILGRLPDLKQDYESQGLDIKYAAVNELTYNVKNGFRAKIKKEPFENFLDVYESSGYTIECDEQWCQVTCDAVIFSNNLPLFVHSYLKKAFGAIPILYWVAPFKNHNHYSQLTLTYTVAYFLGMLVRYFPTHWISLIQGSNGDAIWPTINSVQHLVEKTYPELVIELINDILKEKNNHPIFKGSKS